jgi:hypothetical protein
MMVRESSAHQATSTEASAKRDKTVRGKEAVEGEERASEEIAEGD